jgi:hypothetical protein
MWHILRVSTFHATCTQLAWQMLLYSMHLNDMVKFSMVFANLERVSTYHGSFNAVKQLP